jgi:uncharacterized protein with NRDE domain
VCTVVCRWQPDSPQPVLILALRDELRSRSFDLPGQWWPDFPGVVGGRDRRAGGSWCVTDVARGITAVVLNRPEKRQADPGAPSRGVLPLLAARDGNRWTDRLDVASMAGFNLVLAHPQALCWWSFDGATLRSEELPPGTAMFTPTGRLHEIPDARLLQEPRLAADVNADRHPADDAWQPWLDVVRQSSPTADRTGLLVRRPLENDSYETVFGQLIASAPGRLRLDVRTAVADDPTGPWQSMRWPAAGSR